MKKSISTLLRVGVLGGVVALSWTFYSSQSSQEERSSFARVPQSEIEQPNAQTLDDLSKKKIDYSISDFKDVQDKTLSERSELDNVIELRNNLQNFVTEQYPDSTSDDYILARGRGALKIEIPDLGTAQIKQRAGAEYVEVNVKDNTAAYVFLDSESLPPDSKKLQKFLDHYNYYEPDGTGNQKLGRDVVYLYKNRQELPGDAAKYSQRAGSKKSWKYWKGLFSATVDKPVWQNWVFGTACGMAQVGLTMCMTGAQHMIDPLMQTSVMPAVFAGTFGTTIGVMSSTYRKFTHSGTKVMQALKSSIVSFTYAYAFTIFANGGIETLSILDPAGRLQHLSIVANVLINNTAKVEWQQLVKLRSQMGLNEKMLNFNIPEKKILGFKIPGTGKVLRTALNQADVENQALYLIPFTFRTLDLLGLSMAGVPVGKVLFWLSTPLARRLSLGYAKRLGHPDAKLLEEKWLDTRAWFNPLKWPGKVYNLMLQAKLSCSKAFISLTNK